MELFDTVAFSVFSIIAGIFVLYDIILLYILGRSCRQKTASSKLSYQQAKKIPNSELPVVTILVPLYKEKLTIPYLIESIAKIDYPMDKLDVRFLIERDDRVTQDYIKDFAVKNKDVQIIKYNDSPIILEKKSWNKILINMDYITEGPRTKPNALNVGLRHAKGKILCIYDAEDRPDENQIRIIVAYMLKHSDVACVQAQLAYYNDTQSMLTRLFAIEYIQQFLVSLPTYFSLKTSILLSGTSNFFRIELLKSLGGWDPKNVTEDADLGIKMARKHYRVVPIDMITYEEAPPKIYPWLIQRIRWNKGFLYTLIMHFRNPLKILKEIGLSSFLLTFVQLFSPVISALSLPGWILFTFYWLNWFGMPLDPISKWIANIFNSSPLLFYSSLLTLGFGPIYSILMSLEGLFRQEDYYTLSKVKYVPFTLMYTVLQSVSSVIAIFELIVRPYLWHKTPHGFSIQNKELCHLGST